jgi:predicted metal-dependent phosphoesterase TrpH
LDLLSRARANSADLLAITDHDTVKGLQSLTKLDTGSVRLINGIEFSCHWQNKEIHVVGLNFELEEPKLVKFIQSQQELRKQRAIRIGEKLQKIGYMDTYSAACINRKTESWGKRC